MVNKLTFDNGTAIYCLVDETEFLTAMFDVASVTFVNVRDVISVWVDELCWDYSSLSSGLISSLTSTFATNIASSL